MNEYEVRKTHRENIKAEKLRAIMEDVFGNVQERDGKLVSTFGALKELVAWPAKNAVAVEMVMDPSVPSDVAQSTIKAYNTFLERVTGYNSKERSKRIQKKAKEGKL